MQVKERDYWNFENCKKEALKYFTRVDFQHKSGSAYVRARKKGWLEEICKHMKKKPKLLSEYTNDECKNEALKYKTRLDFKNNSWQYYEAAKRNGWLKEYDNFNMVSKGYWNNIENCRTEALKYKTRDEFSKKSRSAHASALRNNWMDEICQHMIRMGNRYNKCIYAYIFSGNTIYIGLTFNLEKRKFSRKSKKNDSVNIFIKKTNLIPQIIQLTDYLPSEEASKFEEIHRLKYISEGWNVLNRVKGGSLGGKNLIWSFENIKKVAKTCKTKKEFNEKFRGAYDAASKNGWIEEVCSHMLPIINPKGYWNFENCKIEAKKHKNRRSFKNFGKGAYESSKKNGWLNEICSHMKSIPIKNKKTI